MLPTITLLTALASTGLLGHKQCGGGRMHHARARTVACSAPMAVTCTTMTSPQMSMAAPTMAPMATGQAASQSYPGGTPAPAVYATPSMTVPPAPVVPSPAAAPAAPAPTAPAPPEG